jgi:two-component system, LuxR family, sensor kinase FixL
MEHNPVAVGSEPVQTRRAASLHEAAWPDMLTNLHVAYAELTHTQLELERRMGEINETRELFERVVESMTEILFLMDVTGRIIRVNRAAAELFECDEAALLGVPFAELCDTTAIPATPWQLLERAPSGILPHMDIELQTRTGHTVPMSISCGLVRDQRGKITGVLVIARDITARQRAEAERQTLQQQLMEASRRAGMADVAASVLHNVGNVLNSVNVTTNLVASTLRKSPLGDLGRIATMMQEHAAALGDYLTHDPKGQQIPGYLAKLAEYLAHEQATMLQELTALGKNIEHIKQIISMQQSLARFGGVQEPVTLTELMEQALAINLAALERQQIEVVREYAALPLVLVDRHQVLQILVNLISNALHAMRAWPERQHVLTLRVGLAEGMEGWVRLQVHDTGVGIKPEHLTRIFAQGFTTRQEGHGFGLHSSALTAKIMGGALRADSPGEGHGATFSLDLPVKYVEGQV